MNINQFPLLMLGMLIQLLWYACSPPVIPSQPANPQPVAAFALSDVKLLNGPFQNATELNIQYLLKYEPDRLLARFRMEAGLEPKADPYGGWEAQSLAGHSLGHHLSACALMFQSSEEKKFKERAKYIIDELNQIQKANGGGYIGAFTGGQEIFEGELAQGVIRVQPFNLNGIWAPFYTHHKIMAGLRDAYRLLDMDEALMIEKRFADWIGSIVLHLSKDQVQEMLKCEFGGIQETLADLYADTDEEKYLQLARTFHHEAIIDPLAEGRDILPGIHGNTQIPKLIASARLFELTGHEKDRKAATFFWHTVVNHHSYVTGGHGNHEYFGQPNQLTHRLSNETTETCNVYNMLKLSRHLLSWEPLAEVADYYERALFNHILSSQHPETGRVIYNLSLEMGGYKQYQDPEGFTCCVGSGMETHSKYGANIYFHNQDELYVSQFQASSLVWKEKNIKLIQTTGFPEEQSVSFSFKMDEPQTFTFYVRYPYWAENGVHITINKNKHQVDVHPGSFLAIRRDWRDGDQVDMQWPFTLRLECMPDDSNRIAIFYGPIVLAGDLGTVDDSRAANPDYVPVLLTENRSPATWLEQVEGEINTFKTKVGHPRDVILKPFYKTHDRRYSVYFDLYNEAQYQAHLTALKQEFERRKQLEANTYDAFQPGDSISEAEHHFQGALLNLITDFRGRMARGAERGGWLSFDIDIRKGK